MNRVFLIGLLGLIAACSNSNNRPDSGGFYSYVDAQGNLVTLERPPADPVAPDTTDPGLQAADQVGRDALTLTADELAASDGDYLSDEDVQQLIDQRERDRFVSYIDASGYRVTQPVDVVEARKARERQLNFEELGEQQQAYIERLEGIPEQCCVGPLRAPQTLRAGLEVLVSFDRPWQWVSMPTRHPAVAIRLAPEVTLLRVQSFLSSNSYLHPQAVFLNEDGVPLLLVDNLFARRYPETWYRHGYLEGEIPVEAGSRWLVLYLAYAGESASGRPELVPGRYLWAEPSSVLGLKGELLVRGLMVAPEQVAPRR